MTKKIKMPTTTFTDEMYQEIENFKNSRYMNWNEFFEFVWISWKPALDYWKRTGRITFNALKKFKKVWI